VAVTFTIALAIRSVIGSFRSVTPRSINRLPEEIDVGPPETGSLGPPKAGAMTAAFGTKDLEDHTRLVGQFVLDQIKLATAPLKARIAELEARTAELEQRQYHGVYQRACEYKRHALVTHDGSLWIAVEDVAHPNEVPGVSMKWHLCAKRGDNLPATRRPTKPRTLHVNGG
jgi:hypothetical protein